jgi:TRAP transporter TAXI family solute receptor
MSNSSRDHFDVAAYLRKSVHEHPATESHSVENDGEGHWRYALKREAAHLPKGAACLAVGILTNILVAMPLMTELVAPAHAQAIPKSLEEGGTDAALKVRRNTWTVGVAGGQLSGTYMTLADELAEVLDDGDNLRVIPIVTYGAASNLDDLLYLRRVDVAMVQSDVFEYFRTQRKTLNLENRIHYIIRLPVSEMHVLAGTDIKSIEDLRGKKVSFGPAGSASSLTGTIVFQRLGVKVEHVLLDNATALQKLKSGELAALVRVIGKPVGFFAHIPANSGLHLVPIPFSKVFTDHYSLGEFTSQEYPTLVPQGEKIDTIAVPAVLAVFNWPKNTDRYRRVKRFTEALFTNWDKFLEPQRHPKWRDINLAATVPGWTRWSVADEMLSRMQKDPRVAEVQQKDVRAGEEGPAVMNLTQEQREALYYEFLQWQKQRSSVQRSGSNQEQQQQQQQRAQRGLHGRGHGQQQSGTQRGGPQQKQQAAAEHRGPQQARLPSTEGRGPQQKQPLQAVGRRSPQPPQSTEGRGAQEKQQAPTTDGRGW